MMNQGKDLKIIDFEKSHSKIFKDLNQRWIEKYFTMEEEDFKALNFPVENIINKGGHIFMATLNNEVVGTCALMKIKSEELDFELVKMAVDPKAQGNGLGFLLGQACIDKATELNANNVYLESNTVLSTAIRLYRKLGFTEIPEHASPYNRCNIQMVYKIK